MKKYLLRFISKIKKVISVSLFFQSVAGLTSIPLLIGNGITFSNLTIFGNIIFNPILISYMLCGAIIFFLRLIGLNYKFIDKVFEKLSLIWFYILKKAPTEQTFYLSINHGLLLCLILLFFYVGLSIIKLKTHNKIIFSYLLFTFLNTNIIRKKLAARINGSKVKSFFYKNYKISGMLDKNQQVILLNKKSLKKLLRKKSIVELEIKPMLARTFGAVNIL